MSAAEATRLAPTLTARSFFPFNIKNPVAVAQVARMRDGMRLAGIRDHADEDADFGIASDDLLHTNYEAQTPTTAPGVRTIRTPDLAKLVEQSKPLVLDTIAATSREALAEMRRLVGVLRSGAAPGAVPFSGSVPVRGAGSVPCVVGARAVDSGAARVGARVVHGAARPDAGPSVAAVKRDGDGVVVPTVAVGRPIERDAIDGGRARVVVDARTGTPDVACIVGAARGHRPAPADRPGVAGSDAREVVAPGCMEVDRMVVPATGVRTSSE